MIFRVHTNQRYAAISTYHLRDTSLSLQAMGLLSFMLSCNDNFKFSIEGLSKISSCGNAAARSALQQLKDKGYVVVSPIKDPMGKIIEWNYDVYEEPHVENLHVEKPHVEKQRQSNISNKVISIKDNNSSLRSELSESLLSTTITEKNNSSSTTPYSPPSKAKQKFDLSFVADEFREDYTEWLDYRRGINKPFKTQRSVELNYQSALRLSGNDPKIFKQIIEQSIANGWQGLFELKNTNHNGTTSSNGSRSAATGERPEQKERNYNFYSF